MIEFRGISDIKNLLKASALLFIRVYQVTISPAIGPVCRFHPSCSAYAYEAISRYGLLKGSSLAFLRLMRCHPFHPGGIDYVP